MLVLKSLEAILAREERASGSPLADMRVQVALARALLDEVERQVPPSSRARAITEQFIEELAQLGCRILEAATALAGTLDGRPDAPPANAEWPETESAANLRELQSQLRRLTDVRVRKVLKGRAPAVARAAPRARSARPRSSRTAFSAPEPRCPLWARKLS